MTESLGVLLFDVDDTLFDRRKAQGEVLRKIMRQMPGVFAGVDPVRASEAFVESDRVACGEYDRGVLEGNLRVRRNRLFLELLGLDEQHEPEVSRRYVEVYPTVNTPMEGVHEALERLSARFRLGIVSNGLSDVQYHKLDALGIRRFFECVVLSQELGIQKPDPRIFLHAADLLDAKPEECMYVGDRYELDIVGAKNAGMKVCWFNPNGEAPDENGSGPDMEVRSLGELARWMRPNTQS